MYCGCGTGANRSRWTVGVFFLLAAAVLLALSVVERMKCKLCDKIADGLANCRDLPNGRFNDYNLDEVEITECSVAMVGGMFLGGAVAGIVGMVVFFTMCCCAQPPETKQSQMGSKTAAYKTPDMEISDPSIDPAGPHPDWAVPARYTPPPTAVNKPDLRHLGIDGLPITDPTNETSKRSHSGSNSNSRPRTTSNGLPAQSPTAGGQTPPMSPLHGGTPHQQPPQVVKPPSPGGTVFGDRPLPQTRTLSGRLVVPAHAEISPPPSGGGGVAATGAGARNHHNQIYGLGGITPDASPRRSMKSMHSATHDATSSPEHFATQYRTPEGSPMASPRYNGNGDAIGATIDEVPTTPRGKGSYVVSGNPYYSNQLSGQVNPAGAAHAVEESAGLNSYGRPKGVGERYR